MDASAYKTLLLAPLVVGATGLAAYKLFQAYKRSKTPEYALDSLYDRSCFWFSPILTSSPKAPYLMPLGSDQWMWCTETSPSWWRSARF